MVVSRNGVRDKSTIMEKTTHLPLVTHKAWSHLIVYSTPRHMRAYKSQH